jgi:hypothetical protein
MSFRKFGGRDRNAGNNYIQSQYSTVSNPVVSDQVGMTNSRVEFQSHLGMSNNSILDIHRLWFADGTVQATAYTGLKNGDLIVKGSLLVEQNATIEGMLEASNYYAMTPNQTYNLPSISTDENGYINDVSNSPLFQYTPNQTYQLPSITTDENGYISQVGVSSMFKYDVSFVYTSPIITTDINGYIIDISNATVTNTDASGQLTSFYSIEVNETLTVASLTDTGLYTPNIVGNNDGLLISGGNTGPVTFNAYGAGVFCQNDTFTATDISCGNLLYSLDISCSNIYSFTGFVGELSANDLSCNSTLYALDASINYLYTNTGFIGELSANDVSCNSNLYALDASINYLYTNTGFIGELSANDVSCNSNLYALDASINYLYSNTSFIGELSANDLSCNSSLYALDASINYLYTNTGFIGELSANDLSCNNTLYASDASINYLYANTGFVGELSANDLSCNSNLYALDASINYLYANTGFVGELSANDLSCNSTLYALDASINYLYTSNSFIGELSANDVSCNSSLYASDASINYLYANTGFVGELSANDLSCNSNLYALDASINYLYTNTTFIGELSANDLSCNSNLYANDASINYLYTNTGFIGELSGNDISCNSRLYANTVNVSNTITTNDISTNSLECSTINSTGSGWVNFDCNLSAHNFFQSQVTGTTFSLASITVDGNGYISDIQDGYASSVFDTITCTNISANTGLTSINVEAAMDFGGNDINNCGSLSMNGTISGCSQIDCVSFINSLPSNGTANEFGLGIGWNLSGYNQGETDFVCYGDGAEGAFYFYTTWTDSAAVLVALFENGSAYVNGSFQCASLQPPSTGGTIDVTGNFNMSGYQITNCGGVTVPQTASNTFTSSTCSITLDNTGLVQCDFVNCNGVNTNNNTINCGYLNCEGLTTNGLDIGSSSSSTGNIWASNASLYCTNIQCYNQLNAGYIYCNGLNTNNNTLDAGDIYSTNLNCSNQLTVPQTGTNSFNSSAGSDIILSCDGTVTCDYVNCNGIYTNGWPANFGGGGVYCGGLDCGGGGITCGNNSISIMDAGYYVGTTNSAGQQTVSFAPGKYLNSPIVLTVPQQANSNAYVGTIYVFNCNPYNFSYTAFNVDNYALKNTPITFLWFAIATDVSPNAGIDI